MANALGTQEQISSGSDVVINSITYPVDTEIKTALDPDSYIDLGTIDLSSDDSTSAEFCINVESESEAVHNLTASILCPMKGINWRATTVAALDETLATAGSDPTTPYTTTPGVMPDGTKITVTAGVSNRLRFQALGIKSLFGSVAYDPSTDILSYPAQLLLYWEDSSSSQRWDVAHGRVKADAYKNTRSGEAFLIHENGYSLIPLGDFQEPITFNRTSEIESYSKGSPKRPLKRILASAEYVASGSLETEDFGILQKLLGWVVEKDATSGLYKVSAKDTQEIPEHEFVFAIYTAKNGIKWIRVPKGQLDINGDILSMNAESPFNFSMHCNSDSSGVPFYESKSNGTANLMAIDVKFAVTLT